MMPMTVPKSPTNGAVEPMVAKLLDVALQLGVNDSFGTPEAALGGLDFFTRIRCLTGERRNSRRPARSTLARCICYSDLEFLMASSSLPSRSALAMAGANARHSLRAPLNRDKAIIPNPDLPGRDDEQDDHDEPCKPADLAPHHSGSEIIAGAAS